MIAGRLRQIFHRFRGRLIEFDLTPYERLLAQMDAREAALKQQSDGQLKELSQQLMARARAGVPPDEMLVEAFSLVREVSRRTLGMRHFDVQMLGGIALHRSKLIEMQTGEGKTLVAVLPAYLNAMTGRGVHVLTFNDYLVHRPFHFAIVDEADSILIDEARIPLVIAGNTDEVVSNPYDLADLVCTLEPGVDYDTDENARNVYLTDPGLDRAEKALRCDNLTENMLLLSQVYQALHAQALLARDVDYIVRDGKVELVDEFTGRVVEDRHWPHGLQDVLAVEVQ